MSLATAITVGIYLIFALAIPAAAQDETAAREKFNEGIAAAKEGKVDAAIEAYQAAINADSGFADPYLNLGVIYFDREDFENASAMFARFTELNPGSYDGFRSLGYTCIETKDIRTGAAAFEAGLKLKPKDPDLLEGYAELYFEAGKWKEAIERFNAYLPENPTDKRALNDLAKAYHEAGRTQDAIATYEKALKVDPNYWMAHFQLGSLYLDEKAYERAAKEFEKSAGLNKKHWKSFYNLGIARQALETQEDYIEAYHAYSTFLKLTAGMKGRRIEGMRAQAQQITAQLKDYFDAEGLSYER
jgi:tetratricopeptide (TPR) repeat protein